MNLAKIKSFFTRKAPPVPAPAMETLQTVQPEMAHRISSGYRQRTGGFGGEKFSGGMNYPTAFGNDIYKMRLRSMRAYTDSMQARAIIGRLIDTVINTGLALESTPEASILGISSEERKEISNKIETRHRLWGNSKNCDLSRDNTLGQIERVLFRNQLVKGDYFIALPFSDDPNLINPLQLKIISTEFVSTPFDAKTRLEIDKRENYVIDGIEFDKNDEEVAIFVRTRIPGSAGAFFDPNVNAYIPGQYGTGLYGEFGHGYNSLPGSYRWVRFPKHGPVSGRVILIHGKTSEFGNEPRGIPVLAHVAHELEKITDYSILELMAAVANATIALVVEPGENAPATNPLGANSFIPPSLVQTSGVEALTSDTTGDGYTNVGKNKLLNTGGLLVSSLNAGEKLQSHDTKRPNVNFNTFVDGIVKYLAASLGMPIEILHMTFGNNFSASRASLKLYWQSVVVRRDEFTADFKTQVYHSWLLGEVGTGNLILRGYEDPNMRAAWQSANWVGIPSPSIDPYKENRGSELANKNGWETREQTAQRRFRTSFDSNVDRLADENKRLADANEPLAAANAPPAARVA